MPATPSAAAPATPSTALTPAAVPPAAAAFGSTDLLLLLMATIWGANFFAIQYGAAHMDNWAFNTARMAIGTLVLGVVVLVIEKSPWPSRSDTIKLLGAGVIGHGAYQALFIAGVSRTRSGSASLILAASPMVIALFGWLTRTERVTRWLMIAMTIGLAGVALVMFGDHPAAGAVVRPDSVRGNLLVFAACLTWGVYAMLLRPITQRASGLHIALITLLGALPFLLISAFGALRATAWNSLGSGTWAAMAYCSVGAMVIAYAAYYRGMRVLGPTRTAMYSSLQPFVAMLVAWWLQADPPTGTQVAGAALILSGVILARRTA
jgi:drug/metabolite transporter (DMT)-like permease